MRRTASGSAGPQEGISDGSPRGERPARHSYQGDVGGRRTGRTLGSPTTTRGRDHSLSMDSNGFYSHPRVRHTECPLPLVLWYGNWSCVMNPSDIDKSQTASGPA